MTSRRTAVCTICAKNYLHFARTLLDSVAAQQPEWDRFVILVDRVDEAFDPAAERFRVIEAHDLGLPRPQAFCFRYSILELNTAVKPWALDRLFAEGYDRVVYLDPDIRVHRPLREVEEAMDAGAFCVLTPHLTATLDDGKKPSELEILRAGAYNLGFLALARHPQLAPFLDWWKRKLERDCVVDFESGLFVDQKWIDLVPGLYEDVSILRHEGYNVAYWNLARRTIVASGDGATVNGVPLVFFHFSGLDPLAPESFSKHQDRFRLETLGPVRSLVESYCEEVLAHGLRTCVRWPWAYARFSDGTPIPDTLRRYYRNHPELEELPGGEDPFVSGPALFDRPADGATGRGPLVSHFLHATWESRSDLQHAFPDPLGVSRESLVQWFLDGSDIEVGERWLRPVRDSIPAGVRAGVSERGVLTARALAKRVLPSPVKRFVRRVAGPEPPAGPARIVRALGRRLPRGWKVRIRALLGSRLAPPLPARRRRPRPEVLGIGADDPRSAPTSVVGDAGLNVVGYLKAELGLGESSRLCAAAAEAAGLPVSLVDFRAGCASRAEDDRYAGRLGQDNPHPVNLFHINGDQMPLAYATLGARFFDDRYNIGYWAWELPELPDEWLPSFHLVQEVWTPSTFCREAIAEKSPVPVHCMPHPIRFDEPEVTSRAALGLPERRFLVLTMWDMHSFRGRKNPEGALEAFRRAFEGGAEAGLVVKTMNTGTYPEEWAEVQERLRAVPNVTVIDRTLSRRDVYALEASCDVFLSMHRSEGFGLGLAESMYLGKPVVGTDWSGNTDFMRADNSCPVRYELVKLERDHGPYLKGQTWAEPDPEHGAWYLRKLADDASYRERIAAAGRRTVREELSPRAIGLRYARRLEALARWR